MSRIRANTIVDSASTGAPTFPNGAIINGITTITADVATTGNNLTIGTGTTISNPSDNEFRILTNGSEKVRVDSSGVVGVATDSTTVASGANLIVGGRVQSNNGGYWFAGANGAEDGWHVQESSGNLVIVESGVAERASVRSNGDVKIDNGNLVIGTSGKGIDFSASNETGTGTTTSSVLDDYEEGTFTPTLRDANAGGGTAATVGTAVGSYTKIGNMCNMMIRLSQITSTTGMTSGNQIYIGNLPFLIKNTIANSIFIGPAELSSFNTDSGCVNVAAFVNASTSDQTDTRIFQTIDNAGHTSLKVSNIVPETSCEIFINLTVPVA